MKDKACYGHYRLETAEVKPGLLNSHGLILGVFIAIDFVSLVSIKKITFSISVVTFPIAGLFAPFPWRKRIRFVLWLRTKV